MWPVNITALYVYVTLLQFDRNSGKGSEETDMWIAYCHFHLGEYQKAMKVSSVYVLSNWHIIFSTSNIKHPSSIQFCLSSSHLTIILCKSARI